MLILALGALAGCGGGGDDDPSGERPVVDDIALAIAAVEAELGGPQEYFEINATPQLVNLFVASDDKSTTTPYVYLDGELQPPAPRRDVAGGETFDAAALEFDPDTIFTPIAEELDQPDVTQFVIVGGPGDVVQYSAYVASSAGGILYVLLGPDGTVLGVEPA
jgi:hypothetical protein